MADYLATNTARLKVLQQGGRGQHHILFRAAPMAAQAGVIAEARSLCTLFGAFCFNGTLFASAEWAASGSDVFLPVDWGAPIEISSAAGVSNADEYGRYVRFEAKSTGGSRCSWTVFNVIPQTGTANNRLIASENANVADTVAGLNAASGVLCAIDQLPFFAKSYANTGINDAVKKRSRAFA